jgi:glycosyltransferase involved in cell wall biosynthesis
VTRILRFMASIDLAGGGPIEACRRFGEAWARQGHRQDIVTLDPPGTSGLPNYPGEIIHVGPRPGRSLLARYRYSPQAAPWLKANAPRYDAVIVSGLWRYQTRAAWRALSGGPTPYFVFPHGMLDPWFRKVQPIKIWGKQLSWWWAEGPLLRDAAAVLFTTDEERIASHDAFWPYRVNGATVGYGTADVAGDPGAQIAAFRDAAPDLGGRRFLLFLSRIHEKKGCDLLIEAFASIADRDPGLDLVVAGPDQGGLTERLKTQALRLGVASRVHFPGMLTGDAKFGAFRAAEAFTLISHQENFGVVVAEAMACGAPVLISNRVNIWREVAADGAGLIEADTAEGAKTLLGRFLAMSPEERAKMRRSARASFLAQFHVDQAARNLMELIEARITAAARPGENSPA